MITIVNQPKLAAIDFVSIHALKEIHVLEPLNVSPKTTEPNVPAHRDWLVIHSEIVTRKSLYLPNAQSIQSAQQIQLASIGNVLTHALKIIHVLEMQNVVFHCIVHCASVLKDGAEIQRFNVINVS